MKSAAESDNLIAVYVALGPVIFACGLERAFDRLGAGIGEKDPVRERQALAHLARQFFRRGDSEHVGCVPKLPGLFVQGLNHGWMRMAQSAHRDTSDEIKIGFSVFGKQTHTLSTLESFLGGTVYRHDVLTRIRHV